MNISHIRGLIILVIIAFCCRASAQDKQIDTTSGVSTNMVNYFNKAVGQESRLYNGPIFEQYKFRSKTNANFLDTANFNKGWVNYEGVIYSDVLLIYDLNKDMVLCQLYNNFSMYTLLSDRVNEFGLLGHHFIRLVPDSLNKQMDIGFYDELYKNKVQVLARRTKSIQQDATTNFIQSYFLPKTNYYLKLHGKYYSVGSQGSFLSVLKDKKKELAKYLKDNKIRYKDNPEQNMALLAAYYDHITN